MREQMRNNDRIMSNLESAPGGMKYLKQMYENVQVPLEEVRHQVCFYYYL